VDECLGGVAGVGEHGVVIAGGGERVRSFVEDGELSAEGLRVGGFGLSRGRDDAVALAVRGRHRMQRTAANAAATGVRRHEGLPELVLVWSARVRRTSRNSRRGQCQPTPVVPVFAGLQGRGAGGVGVVEGSGSVGVRGSSPLSSTRREPKFPALLTDPWVGSVGEDGAVAAQAEHGERDEGVG
jgi:hypothetical protein